MSIDFAAAVLKRQELLSKIVISDAERKRRALFVALTNRFFEEPAVHKENYSHTGPNSPAAQDLPREGDIPLRSDEESVSLPSREKMKNSLRFG